MPAEKTILPLKTPELSPEEIDAILLKKGVFPVHLRARLSLVSAPPRRPGFIFGPVGVGKTYLAVAYLADIIQRHGEAGKAFVRAYDLMAQIRTSFRPGANEDPVHYFCRYPFLVIDDLGAERDTALVQEALYAILDYRAGHGLATLITSNFSLDRVAGHYGDYGERIASRITSLGPSLELKGKDKRWQK